MFPGYLIPIHELHHSPPNSEIFLENHEHALSALHAESTAHAHAHSFLMQQSPLPRTGAFLPVFDLPPPPQLFYDRDDLRNHLLSQVSSRSSLSARAGSSSEDDHMLLERREGHSEVK